MKNHSIGLIIWRSQVSSLRSEGLPSVNKSQALAGPRFYYSDLRFGVGRCFSFYVTYRHEGFTQKAYTFSPGIPINTGGKEIKDTMLSTLVSLWVSIER